MNRCFDIPGFQNLLAAVGMWLAAPWGGVLWLFTAVAQAFVAVLLPDFSSFMIYAVMMLVLLLRPGGLLPARRGA